MAELDVRHIGGKDYTLGATIYNRVSQRGLIAVRLYEARDRKLGREVAIKEIVVANDDHQGRMLLKRGLEEAQLLVRMGDRDRRHLPIVYDADDTRPQTLAIVMELIKGQSVAAKYIRDAMEPPEYGEMLSMLSIGRDVSHGLRSLHTAKNPIAHRDISPANIMIVSKEAKLIDFGVAVVPARRIARNEEGTPSYRAPEQTSARAFDNPFDLPGPPADIYGLGAVLYHLLTARPVLIKRTPASPDRLNPRIPPLLADALLAMLAPDPRPRPDVHQVYKRLTDSIELLERQAPGSPVTAARTVRPAPRQPISVPAPAPAPAVSPTTDQFAAAYQAHAPAPPALPPPLPPLTPRNVPLPTLEEQSRALRHIGILGAIILVVLMALGIYLFVR